MNHSTAARKKHQPVTEADKQALQWRAIDTLTEFVHHMVQYRNQFKDDSFLREYFPLASIAGTYIDLYNSCHADVEPEDLRTFIAISPKLLAQPS